jgi:hypothetical protein
MLIIQRNTITLRQQVSTFLASEILSANSYFPAAY